MTKRVIVISLVCSSRFPVNTFTDVFFIMVCRENIVGQEEHSEMQFKSYVFSFIKKNVPVIEDNEDQLTSN